MFPTTSLVVRVDGPTKVSQANLQPGTTDPALRKPRQIPARLVSHLPHQGHESRSKSRCSGRRQQIPI
eukprot:753683-Hanusia_phi.AAC.1